MLSRKPFVVALSDEMELLATYVPGPGISPLPDAPAPSVVLSDFENAAVVGARRKLLLWLSCPNAGGLYAPGPGIFLRAPIFLGGKRCVWELSPPYPLCEYDVDSVSIADLARYVPGPGKSSDWL